MSEIAKEMIKIITPKELSESELRSYKDELYAQSLKGKVNFNSLMEIIACRENIIHAIRKIKSNHGFNTAGTDNLTGDELIQEDAQKVFDMIQNQLNNYDPKAIRRVYIPKRNGKLRPLGIPTVIDKIIQTAIANIIEPILEGKFYEHSYGFRPMRQIEHAYAYLSTLVNTDTKRHWIVEGDIKGFFDNVDHNVLIDKLYKYGIRDKRLLMIIKKILKAEIKGVKKVNDIGTPQGGTLSPILANIYLTDFDKWVDEQWRSFKTQKAMRQGRKIEKLKNTSMKQGYLIRYADDWIIITDNEESAQKWKYAAKKFLQDKLKIELSEEKTIITDLSKDKMTFLGIDAWVAKGSKGKMTLRTKPNSERLNEKMKDVYKALKNVRKSSNKAELVENIQRYNAIVRGINNFYRITTMYSEALGKEEWKMKNALNRTKHKSTAQRKKYNECANLYHLHNRGYKGTTLAYQIEGAWIGLECPGIGKFNRPKLKAQWINPYSAEGRAKYEEVTGNKWFTIARNPWLTLVNLSSLIAKNSKEDRIYNLEYFINRAMAFNRDKGKCRICKQQLVRQGDIEIHHIDKELPIDKINKIQNLATTCPNCHDKIHTLIRKKQKPKVEKPKQQISRSSVKPDKETLLQQITTMPMTQVAKLYNVSDNAVRKWAKSYDIFQYRKNQLRPQTK